MQWHLARDNQAKLAKFCEKHAKFRTKKLRTNSDGEHEYWQMSYHFDNGSYIEAEMLHGDTKSYSVADHFQVVDYGWATA